MAINMIDKLPDVLKLLSAVLFGMFFELIEEMAILEMKLFFSISDYLGRSPSAPVQED
jgi:hypothetical protein